MNVTLSRRSRQSLAVCILILLIFMAWSLLARPILDLTLDRQAEVSALYGRVAQFRAVQARAPQLAERERRATQQLRALGVLWSGPSRSAIAASMQDLIHSAALQSGGVVTSTSMISPEDAAGSDALTVRARVEGTLDTLQRVLTAIDATKPKLFVDSLTISAEGSSTRDRPQQLSFEFSLAGYLAGPPHAN